MNIRKFIRVDLWDDYKDKISPEAKKDLESVFENMKYEAFHGDDGRDDY